MKIQLLSLQAPPGSRVALLLISGEEVTCDILEYGDGHLLVDVRGRQRRLFDDAITGFEVIEAARSGTVVAEQKMTRSVPPESLAVEVETRNDEDGLQSLDSDEPPSRQTLAWMGALSYADKIRTAFRFEGGDLHGPLTAARELANRYAQSSTAIQSDSNVRFALIQVFKTLESARRNRSSDDSLALSEALVQVNAALRLSEGVPPEQRFIDLYHALVAVGGHAEYFEAKTETWTQLGNALREARNVGLCLLKSPAVAAQWEQQPFQRPVFFRRLAAVCQHLVEFGFAGADAAAIKRQAAEFAAQATDAHEPPQSAMGQIVAYGAQRFGFIESPDGRTFYFRFDDVLADDLRRSLITGQLDIEVDFDERPPEPGRKYARAFSVRPPGTVRGEIKRPVGEFGFVILPDQRDVHFLRANMRPPDAIVEVGTPALCRPHRTQHGTRWASDEIYLIADGARSALQDTNSAPHAAAQRFLADALLARRREDWELAANLYEEAWQKCLTPQVVMSYAAMRRDQNDDTEALKILEDGIKHFKDNPKLHEDAGVLARLMGDHQGALDHLRTALKLCRDGKKPGEKGALVALARTYFRLDDMEKAVRYYDEAVRAFGTFGLPIASDQRQHLTAQFCLHHDFGRKIIAFLREAGLKIVRGEFLNSQRSAAELLVRTDNEELIESYGLQRHEQQPSPRYAAVAEFAETGNNSSQLLVRVHFGAKPGEHDVNDFEERIKTVAASGQADEQTGLLFARSFDEPLQKFLNDRLNDRRDLRPAIVPIRQEDLEAAREAGTTLRSILDRWLFRRDLFALKDPVVGPRFFGRTNALADLRDAISHGESVGVFGLRRIGKTSLLLETARRATANGDLVAFVNLQRNPADIEDTRWLFWELANQLWYAAKSARVDAGSWRLGGIYERVEEIPPGLRVATAFAGDLAGLLQAVRASATRRKILLIIDEVEELMPTAEKPGLDGFRDFLKNIRGAVQDANGDIAWVVMAANASICEVARWERRDNPVFGFFREIYLQMLEPPVCAQMISTLGRGIGIKFDSGALDQIYFLTGGHPFITRHFCSFIHGRHEQRPLHVTPGMVDALVPAFLEVRGALFNEIYVRLGDDYPEDLKAILEIARRDGTMTIQQLRVFNQSGAEEVLRRLRSYQLINVREGWVTFSIALFRFWLLRRAGQPIQTNQPRPSLASTTSPPSHVSADDFIDEDDFMARKQRTRRKDRKPARNHEEE